MSEENKDNVAGGNEPSGSNPKDESSKYVSAKAYEEVSKDMHKFKSRAKELEAAHNEVLAQLKAQEEAKLMEQNKWEEIAKNREAEIQQIKRDLQEKDSRFTRSVKMQALKQELGGKVKDVYLQHAELNSIGIRDDGSVDSETLLQVANKFRQEHGQLIPSDQNVNITGQAASTIDSFPAKSVNEMTMAEKQEALNAIYANKK